MTTPARNPRADDAYSELPVHETDRMARDFAAQLDDEGDAAWLRWRDLWVAEYLSRQPRANELVRV